MKLSKSNNDSLVIYNLETNEYIYIKSFVWQWNRLLPCYCQQGWRLSDVWLHALIACHFSHVSRLKVKFTIHVAALRVATSPWPEVHTLTWNTVCVTVGWTSDYCITRSNYLPILFVMERKEGTVFFFKSSKPSTFNQQTDIRSYRIHFIIQQHCYKVNEMKHISNFWFLNS